MGAEIMRQLERLVMLRAVDNRWVRHLTDLDELREGIGLRAFAQQDPLVAYKKEAHEMYQELVASISRDIVQRIYHAQFMVAPARMPVQRMQTNRGDGGGQAQPVRSSKDARPQRSVLVRQRQEVQDCHMRADQGREPAPASDAGSGAAGRRGSAEGRQRQQPGRPSPQPWHAIRGRQTSPPKGKPGRQVESAEHEEIGASPRLDVLLSEQRSCPTGPASQADLTALFAAVRDMHACRWWASAIWASRPLLRSMTDPTVQGAIPGRRSRATTCSFTSTSTRCWR